MNACLRAWALLAVVCAAHAAGPDVVSVPIAELDGRADLDGRTVEVEGRLYIWAPTQVRLLRSKAKFRIDGGEFPKPPSRDANVHMVGRVRAERGGLTVLVSTIRFLPSDLARFAQRRVDLAPKDYKGRYVLGRWGRRRAQLYDDRDLLAQARAVLREAVRLEADVLGAKNPDVLVRLAAKSKRVLPEEQPAGFPTAQELYLQAAAHLRRAATSPMQILDVAAKLRQWLPTVAGSGGADHARPGAGAPSAAAARRYRDLLSQAVDEALSPGDPVSPGDLQALADRIRRLGPGRTDLIDRLDRAVLERQLGRIPQMTDAEVQALVARLSRQRPPLAKTVRQLRMVLLVRRRKRLEKHEVRARIELSDEFLAFGQAQEARALLEEAYRVAPHDRTLRVRLSSQGYWWDGDKLVPPGLRVGSRSRAPLTKKRVRSQLGEPDRVCRALTGEGVVEQWVFKSDPPVYFTFRGDRAVAASLHMSDRQRGQ